MCGVSGQAVDEDGHRWFSSEVFKATDEENQTMAENLSMALAELQRKADAEPDVDTLRDGVRVLTQALMELEVAGRGSLANTADENHQPKVHT